MLNKPNKWLNSKKKALNRPKKHLKRLRRSIYDASKGLRVLLDKASSSDLLFIKKKDPKSQKYIPNINMKRATHGRVLLRRHLSNKKVGVIDRSLWNILLASR